MTANNCVTHHACDCLQAKLERQGVLIDRQEELLKLPPQDAVAKLLTLIAEMREALENSSHVEHEHHYYECDIEPRCTCGIEKLRAVLEKLKGD